MILIFISALLAGIVGSEVGHKFKPLKRTTYAKIAVHLCSGFSGALLALVIKPEANNYQLPLAILIGIFFGFFMANAKIYDAIK